MTVSIEGVLLTSLKMIDTPGGIVMHGMRVDDPGYTGFGEAYFSVVESGAIKAWKRHRKMTLNLVVPVGRIRFVIYDDRAKSSTYGKFQQVILSRDHYCRLTIPPMIWVGFQGMGKAGGMLLNVASIQHDPSEADRKSIKEIAFNWQ